MTDKSTVVGECRDCSRERTLMRDGLLPRHSRRNPITGDTERCPGSHESPRPGTVRHGRPAGYEEGMRRLDGRRGKR